MTRQHLIQPLRLIGQATDSLDDVVVRKRFVGSVSETVTIALLAILPFLPRPTLEHPVRFVVPVFILFFLATNARRILATAGRIPAEARFRELVGLGGLLFMSYLAWSLANDQWGELSRVIARGLWIAVYLVLVAWFFLSGISLNRVYRCIFFSAVALSALVIFVGFTGVSIFEAPRPGRNYGIAIPFYKNTGVPRSYGEFGILMSMAWAYWLVHFRRLGRATRAAAGLLLIAAVFISQSRSTYLAIIVVTAAFGIHRLLRRRGDTVRKRVFQLLFIGALLMPVGLEAILASPIGQLGIFQALMGEQVIEENVLVRFIIIGSALEALLGGGVTALFGISHAAWDANFEILGQQAIALHNHFLSNLVFYGFVGGLISLFTFFLWPFACVLRRQVQVGDRTSLVALLALYGGIVNLHFYEGFFSLILALELALLWCIGRGVMLETRRYGGKES